MSDIILITGNVKFTITLDPGVWIFDDRKIDLNTYFAKSSHDPLPNGQQEEEEEIKKLSAFWDREIQEGAVFPPTLKTEKRFLKEKIITGTFAMPLAPFLQNAEPLPEAKELAIVTEHNEVTIPLAQAYEAILGFSKDGKPLREDGPVHFYFGDGSNREAPITHVRRFVVR
ncbi:hypothetical protein [Parageobacillus thermoglucosidasius]|uniref:Peptidyl-prolyl cis-trans isomerase n=1 Tax=Geobacillus sp. (strain Y4.1MC1) TaxID=581103 RepID=A0A7U3YH27_GEOS0|nr:hypothetical protein [Parageobacillus thermoglucosidasius]EID43370.1 hypothetical protein GT20_2499 [Parageobacillus thermoglucosidasius TNO-09.020]KYD14939.1 hypothetical protein B4168_2148 [Anoxybacillus flavithermus]OAO85804.1 hypothetical protein GT23_2707 [Parageobacillus thermoglucosidasius]RDE34298.1 peptidyl-prolyl cis-trans isomerase [Parageobacillus thermoglucosidasius]